MDITDLVSALTSWRIEFGADFVPTLLPLRASQSNRI